jgi:hypothetical protein
VRTTSLGGSGAALNPNIYLVDRDTGALSPLTQWATLELSPLLNAVGSCTLTYPVGGSAFDTLAANVGPTTGGTLDQEIEVRLTGALTGRTRWLLQQKQGDDLDRGTVWQFAGVSLEQLLGEVFLGPQATSTKELTFSGATAGTVLATVFDQIAARDAALLPGMSRDFTTTHDSGGVAWADTVTGLKFGPTDTLLTVAQALVELGMVEFEVSAARVLRAYRPDSRGRDRSTGASPLRFSQGTNLAQADRRESARVGDAATAVLAKGAEGVYAWVSDPTAEAVRGRRVEAAHDAGQLTSTGAVTAAGQSRLDALKDGVSERSHGITFVPGAPIPGIDFNVGDWALSFVGTAGTRLRIQQWTAKFERARGAASATVTMNDVIADRVVDLQRQLAAQSRGGAVVGTSTAPPLTDDGKSPAAPTGLTASSSAYRDADGATWASVSAAWAAVTTNADATAADDVAGYVVQFRYTGGAPLPTSYLTVARVAGVTADWDGVVAGQPVEVQVAAVDRAGNQGAYSTAFALTSGADATPPPVASAPTVDNLYGILRIVWDGLGAAAEPMPPDFLDAQMYGSTSETFAVGDPGVIRIGALRGAQTYAWSPPGSLGAVDYGTTWYVRLLTRDRNGNAAALSAAGSAVPGKVAEGDVASVNIGVLTAGILNTILTVGDTITTGETGEARVTMDTTGLYCLTDADVAVLSFSIAEQLLTIIGEIIAGDPDGNRVVVDPDTTSGSGTIRPGLSMYHDSGAAHSAFYARTAPGAVGGSRFWLANKSDASTWDGALITGDKGNIGIGFTSGAVADAGATATGGFVTLRATTDAAKGAYLIYNDASAVNRAQLSGGENGVSLFAQNSSGVVKAYLTLDPAGGGHLDSGGNQMIVGSTANNYLIINSSSSQLVSGGVVKSFVIDHPTDADRYLVHACTESPTAGIEYWGTAVLDDELAVVNLPDYFEALAEVEGRAVFLQPELTTVDLVQPLPRRIEPGPDGQVAPAETRVIRRPIVFSAMPSEIKGGQFHIVAPGAPAGARVHWQVKATRRGAPFDPEPRRDAVEVLGDGPYRWPVPKPPAHRPDQD